MLARSLMRRSQASDTIAWNDVEALPLHGATLLLATAVAFGIADAGPQLQSNAAKAACIVGCLGLRAAWLGMDRAGGPQPSRG